MTEWVVKSAWLRGEARAFDETANTLYAAAPCDVGGRRGRWLMADVFGLPCKLGVGRRCCVPLIMAFTRYARAQENDLIRPDTATADDLA